MSIEVVPTPFYLPRMDFNSDPDRVVAMCSKLMLGQDPAVIFDDFVLRDMLLERTLTPEMIDGDNNLADQEVMDHLTCNAERLAYIFSNLRDSGGVLHSLTSGTSENSVYVAESDQGGHIDGASWNADPSIGVHTILTRGALLAAGTALKRTDGPRYTDIGVYYSKPEELPPGSISCFFLGGTKHIRSSAHKYTTTGVGDPRIFSIMDISVFKTGFFARI
jgi:hypothetical protein